MRALFLLPLFLAAALSVVAADPSPAPFEIREGDRVVLLGDTLLERENSYGHLETLLHEQFPDRRFTVRNLSWAGDTPLGWSRASFDAPAKGWERLKEQIAQAKPTVVILGYGMAASLQEMTDRSGDHTLNPDPARYGTEPYSAPRFKKELAQLMDAIVESAGAPKASVRFVLLSPIRHEDLRATKPGLPDPAAHNQLLDRYSEAIEELAKEKEAAFLDMAGELHVAIGPLTENGIHLTEQGFLRWSMQVKEALLWGDSAKHPRYSTPAWRDAIRAAVLRKNELFFHQFRPANATYLTGFRKHEQGQNAKELAQFEPLIETADAEIDRVKRLTSQRAPVPEDALSLKSQTTAPLSTKSTPVSPSKPPAIEPSPLPDFAVAEGYQIELWAENPFLEKPTQMNWDAEGRLWVCSSSLYPQIAPGEPARDKILILEDTDRDGKADKSTVFADSLLIPTGVEPDLGFDLTTKGAKGAKAGEILGADSSSRASYRSRFLSASYVGQSTELLRFADTDGDGKSDAKRIVFSGFGTEDTHHIIHTLHWGPDGRLFFNQSVYIHSHIETPYGMVRLNSGGIFAYDPRTERLEVFARGWWNSWGHQMDRWGQSFATDGAGNTGISWVIPGGVYDAYEGGRRKAPGISPGSYPKFCGLELITSPHFPDDWQGNAITCDFRAHRIVRFTLEDLSEPPEVPKVEFQTLGKAGYVAKEQPDLVRTSDLSFRPIDVKLGPDGALYVADWSNPIIQHGEVDFRDARRDKHRGRIWRISRKGAPVVKWEALADRNDEKLLDGLLSQNLWEKEQTRRLIDARVPKEYSEIAQERWDDISSAFNRWAFTDFREAVGPANVDERELASASWHVSMGHFSKRLNATGPARAAILRSNGTAMRLMPPVAFLAQNAKDNELDRQSPARGDSHLAVGLWEAASHISCAHRIRVRLEGIRALGRVPTAESAGLVLDAILPGALGSARFQRAGTGFQPGQSPSPQTGPARAEMPADAGKMPALPGAPSSDDPFLDYAAWLSINELAKPWTDAIARGEWKIEGREAQLAYGLTAIEPALASATLSKVLSEGKIDLAQGPWIELIGKAGGPAELQRLLDHLETVYGPDCCDDASGPPPAGSPGAPLAIRMADALAEAARTRNTQPPNRAALARLLVRTPEALQLPLARLIGLWKIDKGAEVLQLVLAKKDLAAGTRRAAIEALGAIGNDEALRQLAALCARDQPLATRREAVVALAGARFALAAGHIPAILDSSTDEQEALETWRQLLRIKEAAEGLADHYTPKSGRDPALPKPVGIAGLRAARELGKKGEALAKALAPLAGVSESEAKPPQSYGWMTEFTKRDGDPARGELIYRRANLACVSCHAIGGAGGKVGPEMTSLGASAPLDYIIESVLNPGAKVKEGYNAVNFTLKDDTQVMGVLARETAQELILRDVTGREQSVVKANVVSKTDIGSIMPAGLVEQLPERERWDLFAFLGQLGKAGGFDASKGRAARVWTLYPAAERDRILGGELKSDLSVNAYSLVDGRLPKEQLAEALQLLPNPGDVVYAAARFQSGGRTVLNLLGVKKGWLDGKPLELAGEIAPDLAAGEHILVVELDPKQLPDTLRAESPEARFLGN